MNCSHCNSKTVRGKSTRYHYVESGLSHVYLKGVPLWSCPKCGEEEVEIPDPAGLQDAIARVIVSKESRLTGKEFRFLRSYLGHSGADIAARFAVARETISRWETGALKVPGSADVALRYMVLTGKANHDYKVTDLNEILESRCRIKFLEARFRDEWMIEKRSD
ncbi:type II TA system antitoxin MqsA family protein [Bdellovibrionota bacterium FG-2]